MSNNVIEEYLIKIGVSTDKASKVAKDLKAIGKEVEKSEKEQSLIKKKATDQEYIVKKNLEKTEKARLKREVDLAKVAYAKKKKLLEQTAYVEQSRRRQTVQNLMEGKSKELSSMSDYYKKLEKESQASYKNDLARDENKRKLENKKKAERAKLLRERKAQEQKEHQARLKDLQERLKAYKKSKAAQVQVDNLSQRKFTRNAFATQNKRIDVLLSPTFQNLSRINPTQAANFKQQIDTANSVRELITLQKQMVNTLGDTRRLQKQLFSLHTVQNGLADSTRNMVRSYASLFAVMAGVDAVKQVGMDFEGMRAAMLAATGEGENVKDNLKFVDDLATRLGTNLKDATDSYIKLKFAAKGKMGTEEVEALFTAVSELGTSLKINPEAMKGGLRALGQMLNKNQLMAEEVKSQFSEHIPGGLSIFSRALGVTEKEFLKLMEQGKLMASEVLPLVTKEMHKAARANGALDQALKSVSVTQGQMITQSQKSADIVFQSGFGEGLSNLFKTITDILKGLEPQLKKIGKMFKWLFDGIAYGLKVVEPFFKILLDNLHFLIGARLLMGLRSLSVALGTAFLPITAAYVALEEIASLLSDKLVGNLESSLGYQVNLKDMTTSSLTKQKDGSYTTGTPTEIIPQTGFWASLSKGFNDYAPPMLIARGITDMMFGSDKTSNTVVNNSPTYVINSTDKEGVVAEIESYEKRLSENLRMR
jgi:tape measure domain-containing protein